jgi:hypothetical protein
MDTDGEGRSSTFVPGVAGPSSDRRGRGTFGGSVISATYLNKVKVLTGYTEECIISD